MGSKNAVFDS